MILFCEPFLNLRTEVHAPKLAHSQKLGRLNKIKKLHHLMLQEFQKSLCYRNIPSDMAKDWVSHQLIDPFLTLTLQLFQSSSLMFYINVYHILALKQTNKKTHPKINIDQVIFIKHLTFTHTKHSKESQKLGRDWRLSGVQGKNTRTNKRNNQTTTVNAISSVILLNLFQHKKP